MPAATAPAAPTMRAARHAATGTRRQAAIAVAAALTLATLSLLLPWALAFDPQMWLVWGRDVTHLALDTRAGPSWKPGPVLLTAPFSVVPDAAPALWLVVARAGALLALAGAWVLGRQLAGPVAGAAAAGAILLAPWWLPNAALGNSEGLIAAAVLWAITAHLTGRDRTAVLLGLAAALLRPEAWPFLGLYGLWAWRARPATRPVLVAAAVAVPVLWFGPDVTGGGGALGASDAARGDASEGSAKNAEFPVLAVLWYAVEIGGVAVALAALAGLARRDGERATVRVLFGGAIGWIAIVAAMTAVGYAGNPRYLVAAAAVLAVLAGVAAARWLGWAALLVPLAVGAFAFTDLRDDLRDVGVRADRREALPQAIAAAGGRDALVRCGPIRTAPVVRGLVAWELDVGPYRIDAPPQPPAVVVQMRPYDGVAPQPAFMTTGYRRLGAAGGWTVWGACDG